MRIIKLALIGLGTVGTGVAKLLEQDAPFLRTRCGAELVLRSVVVRDVSKPRKFKPAKAQLTADLAAVLSDPEIDVVVELMGGVKGAFEVISSSLRAGKHVVTANKAVLAERGRELFRIAHDVGKTIGFEASVGGGIPIIAAVSQSLAGNRILSLAGILNGTTNFILSAMHDDGVSYYEALAQAQSLGFAEADPTMDVDGTDAAQKLALLARLAFRSDVDANEIRRQGINRLEKADLKFAREIGYVIKLLARAQVIGDELHLSVAPTLVHNNHPLGQVRNEYNAVQIVGETIGDTLYVGKGAGMMPTASSVLSNVLDVAIGRAQPTFEALRLWEEDLPGPRFVPRAYFKSRFYLRYSIADQPGTLAQITSILGKYGISISSVVQHESSVLAGGGSSHASGVNSTVPAVPLVIMTHVADEGVIQQALAETEMLDLVRDRTVCLPVAD